MINIKNVTKNYSNNLALDDFSIEIKQPGIYCLLGRNGAGKTTLLKSIAGHIGVSGGEVIVCDNIVSKLDMPRDVHFVETSASHFDIRLEKLFRAAKDINPDFDYDFALKLAGRFKLNLRKRYDKLSFGMKAMANTLIALASGREILLLDEPVLGFDPVMRKEFYDMLQESMAEKPRVVIVSTHIIDEISKVAEQLIIINKGKLVMFSDINEIDEKAYSVTGVASHVEEATKGLNILGETKAGGFISRYVYDKRIEESDKYAIAALGLQEFFVGLVSDEEGAM